MVFKRTLQTNADGDINPDDAKRYAMIDGIEGVTQELKDTLTTVRGEDPFAPDHGLRVFEIVGAPNEVLDREIRFALDRDDRVESIESVETTGDRTNRTRQVDVAVALVSVPDTVEFGVEMQ